MAKILLYTSYCMIEAQLKHFQGELLEVYLPANCDQDSIQVGQFLTCFMHNKYMDGRIIRMDGSQLSIFLAVTIPAEPLDRRLSERRELDISAVLVDEDSELAIQIHDISYTGVGISCSNGELKLDYDYHMMAYTESLSFVARIRLIQQYSHPDGLRYGGEMVYVDPDSISRLRGYLLCRYIMQNRII